MSSTTAVMLQDRLNDIERNICDGIDFRQELNEAYALADELQAENDKLRELVGDIWEFGFSNSAGANSVKEWYRVRDELEQRVYAALGVDDG